MVNSKKNKSRKYVLFSTNQLASNYICERLNNINDKFGNPKDFIQEKGDINTRLSSSEKSGKTSDGFFGLRINLPQIKNLNQAELQNVISFFDFIILITSRNKFELATIKALVTNKETKNAENWIFIILRKLNLIVLQERRIFNITKQSNKLILEINYEDLYEDSNKIFFNLIYFISEHKKIRFKESLEALPKLRTYKKTLIDKYMFGFLNFLTGKSRSNIKKPTLN